MKRVLLTGAGGFIGAQAMAPLLHRGYQVHAVHSRTHVPVNAPPEVIWHRADLMDQDVVTALMDRIRPSHLLHFAWYVQPGQFWNSAENFRWVAASLGLLRAFSANGGRRVVMAGTCAEYDWAGGLLEENSTPLAPRTPYGVCKHALRLLLDSYAETNELSVAWGRIFFLYGPREYPQRLVASTIGNLLAGQPALCSEGSQRRDFLHVADVAAAFVALLDSSVRGPVNIASGQPVAIKDLVLQIGDLLGRRDLIRIGALPSKENEPAELVGAVRRLGDEVGWSPSYSLESGLGETVAWWRATGAAGSERRER